MTKACLNLNPNIEHEFFKNNTLNFTNNNYYKNSTIFAHKVPTKLIKTYMTCIGPVLTTSWSLSKLPSSLCLPLSPWI